MSQLSRGMGVRSVGDGNPPATNLALHLAARLFASPKPDWWAFEKWLDTAHGYNYQLLPELASFLATRCTTIDQLESKLCRLRHYILSEQLQLLSILETYYAPQTQATEPLQPNHPPFLPEEV